MRDALEKGLFLSLECFLDTVVYHINVINVHNVLYSTTNIHDLLCILIMSPIMVQTASKIFIKYL